MPRASASPMIFKVWVMPPATVASTRAWVQQPMSIASSMSCGAMMEFPAGMMGTEEYLRSSR